MLRTFQLTNEPDGLGLRCTEAGLSLAGVPLLQKTEAGFVPRPAPDIAALINAAYGADPTRLQSSVDVIAQALNRGDLARAMITAVLTRTPELSRSAAARLAHADEKLTKYDPEEPRDWRGRWTTGGAGDPTGSAAPAGRTPTRQESNPAGFSNPKQGADRNALLIPVASTTSDDEADDHASQEPTSLIQSFEKEYDDLGPVEFAKRVIQFGDWIERTRGNLSPADKERALAEYAFLQDRLSLWLAYEYKPPVAHANLISAAMTLFQGVTNSGLVRPGELPRSMLYVGTTAWAFDNIPPRSPSIKPFVEEPLRPPPFVPLEGIGGIVDNSEVGIVWGKGIKEQGNPFNVYHEKQNPDAPKLPKDNSKGFDQFNQTTGEAISNKTLDTLTARRIRNPQDIYKKMAEHINAAANYERPRVASDPDPAKIESRTLHVAVPEFTSPTQWRYLFRAIIYGKTRGVRVVITRIRE